jgi:hypothetical protein
MGKGKTRSRFPEGMTERKARAKATTRATASAKQIQGSLRYVRKGADFGRDDELAGDTKWSNIKFGLPVAVLD